MPIEIKELVIRAIVEEKNAGQKGTQANRQPAVNQQQIVAECVEQVMEILRRKQER